ncbi:MAG: acyl carrier protein [Bacteroidota bacterium]
MEQEFINLFKETLEINNEEITLDTKFRDIENWDSLKFLTVLAMIDEEYDIIIEGNTFQKLQTIDDLINAIKERKG